MYNFENINIVAKRFVESSKKNTINLNELDDYWFCVLIYTLETCRFNITGLTDKSFLRYFLATHDDNVNLSLQIINNLPYTKQEFIDKVNFLIEKHLYINKTKKQ